MPVTKETTKEDGDPECHMRQSDDKEDDCERRRE